MNQAKIATSIKQKIVDGYMRVFAWRGSEKMAISAQTNKIHLAIACWPWPHIILKKLEKLV